MVDNSVSVTAGSTAVVGNITSFSGGEWDMFSLVGLSVPVQSVEDTSHLTLKYPWPGPTLTDQVNWRLVPFGDASRTNVAVNQKVIDLLNKISAGTLALIGNLKPAADKLPYFTDANTAALTTLTQKARDLLDDPDAAAMLATLGLSNVALKDVANVFSQLNTFEVGLTAKRSGVGGAALTNGNGTNSGYLALLLPDGTRLGYLGFSTLSSGMIMNSDAANTSLVFNVGGATKASFANTIANFTTNAQVSRVDAGQIVNFAIRNNAVGGFGQARLDITTGTSNAYLLVYVAENNAAPYAGIAAGPGISYIRLDPNNGSGIVVENGILRPVANNSIYCGTNGAAWAGGYIATNWVVGSDGRSKFNTKDSDLGLSFIQALRPVSYQYIIGQNSAEEIEDPEDMEEYEEQATEAVLVERSRIEMIEGKAVQIVETTEEDRPLFRVHQVFDADGNVVFSPGRVEKDEDGNEVAIPGTPLLHHEPVMVTKSRPKKKVVTTPRPGVRRHYGLIAQEVQAALQQAGCADFGGHVLEDKDDPDSHQSLRYEQFIAVLIKAVQELAARVAALEAHLAAT